MNRSCALLIAAMLVMTIAGCGSQTQPPSYKDKCLSQETDGDILYLLQIEKLKGNPHGTTITENCATRPPINKGEQIG